MNIDGEAVLLLSEGKGFGRPFPSLTHSFPRRVAAATEAPLRSLLRSLGMLVPAVACTLAGETGLTHIEESFHKAMFTFL